MNRKHVLLTVLTVFLIFVFQTTSCNQAKSNRNIRYKGEQMTDKLIKSDEEWRKILTPEQFNITRKKGTELAFSGEYNNLKDKGFHCFGLTII